MAIDLEKIREIAERVVASEGLTLVDVELKGARANPLLRIYIDQPRGVNHAHCQAVSEQIGAMLEVEDAFPSSYTLEVSSPGLDRKLKLPAEYRHFVGRKARLVLSEPLGQQRVLEGRLTGFEGGFVRLDTGDGGVTEIPFSNISKARLLVEEMK